MKRILVWLNQGLEFEDRDKILITARGDNLHFSNFKFLSQRQRVFLCVLAVSVVLYLSKLAQNIVQNKSLSEIFLDLGFGFVVILVQILVIFWKKK
jgi:hypothetical protein